MKIKNLFLALTAAMGLCACGTSAQTSSETPVTTIVPQTDPLVIELDTFENRTFGSDRAFIVICDNIVKGQIPTVNGMVTSRFFTFSSRYALQFDNCSAKVYEPKFNRKGTEYSFSVYVDNAKFFDSFIDTDWRLYFIIDGGGYVTMQIESTTLLRARSTPTWTFRGHVNTKRTEALKLMKGSTATDTK